MRRFVNEDPAQRLIVWSPPHQMDRAVAQQGVFTVSLDALADHGAIVDDFLASQVSRSGITYAKLRLPAALKPDLMLHLRYMNIAAHSLFPGADGLGRSVADIIRVGHLPGEPQ